MSCLVQEAAHECACVAACQGQFPNNEVICIYKIIHKRYWRLMDEQFH